MNSSSKQEPFDWRSFAIEHAGASSGHCDCCGSTTKRVWGFVRRDRGAVAAYFVGWAERRPDHGASFELVLGKWGQSATRQDRYAVALDFQVFEGSPQFMIVDAQSRFPPDNELAATALKRSEVVETLLAPQVFALIDAIYIGDTRLNELRAWQSGAWHGRLAPYEPPNERED